jgi:hypothetical protein
VIEEMSSDESFKFGESAPVEIEGKGRGIEGKGKRIEV